MGGIFLGEDVCDGSAHVKSCFFFLGGCFCSLARAGWALRTRHKLAFSFWAGTLVLWLGRTGRSAHVTNSLFLFGRVLWFSGSGGLGAPHTSQTCFFFLGGCYRFSDHAFLAKSLSGMTHLAKNRLRTRISRITAPSSPRKNRARRSAPDSVPSFPGSPNSPVFPNSPNLPQSPFPTLSSQPASTSQIAFSKICNPSSISSFLTLSGVANRMPFP